MAGYGKNESNDQYDNEGKLFVGGLAWESSESSIKRYFEKWGQVEAVTLKKNKDDPSKHRGFCFVKYADGESAERCLAIKEPHMLDGSRIDPKSACPIGVKPEQRTKKIFVGGLQAETTDEKLHEYFSQFGEIVNKIEYALDRQTQKKRGFCFIEFANEAIVDRIVRDQFHEVAGKKLETKRALSKVQQQELAVSQGVEGNRRLAYGGIALATPTPYAQPVIYIHPDSLSTSYPLQALGLSGITGYPATTAYTSALETLYTPYGSRDNRGGTTSSRVIRHDPYRK
jgi:RNA recognition motif-containing protein